MTCLDHVGLRVDEGDAVVRGLGRVTWAGTGCVLIAAAAGPGRGRNDLTP
jgi:hypothetical protein